MNSLFNAQVANAQSFLQKRAVTLVAPGLTFIAALLSACGSGPGTGPNTFSAPPTTPATPAISYNAVKEVVFNWDDVADATYYQLLENPDGMSGFDVVKTDIQPNTGTLAITVPLYNRLNASYILQSCNNAGCVDSNTMTVSSSLAQAAGYFKASNTNAADGFGSSIALNHDGTLIAIGAAAEASNATGVNGDQSVNAYSGAGAVYVFRLNNGNWQQEAYLKASNTQTFDLFGVSVSFNKKGDILAVGALLEDSGNSSETNNSASGAGAVYVFSETNGSWSQQAYLKATDAASGDNFGEFISLDALGETLAISATGKNNAEGAVYVFSRQGALWTQDAIVKPTVRDSLDFFGFSVVLNATGTVMAVGAPGEDSAATGVNGATRNNTFGDSGAVYVFENVQGTWAQNAYLKASNTEAYTRFGESVDISDDGNIIAASSPYENSWVTGTASTGSSTAIGPQELDSGAVYVFSRDSTTWSQTAYIKPSNTGANDNFGAVLSLSGDGLTLAVGAHLEDSSSTGINSDSLNDNLPGSGAAYVFSLKNLAWHETAYIKSNSADEDDWFGIPVSLSGDGKTLGIGAQNEASNATGIGGDSENNGAMRAGAVYLY